MALAMAGAELRLPEGTPAEIDRALDALISRGIVEIGAGRVPRLTAAAALLRQAHMNAPVEGRPAYPLEGAQPADWAAYEEALHEARQVHRQRWAEAVIAAADQLMQGGHATLQEGLAARQAEDLLWRQERAAERGLVALAQFAVALARLAA
jgi:hypothetical protein